MNQVKAQDLAGSLVHYSRVSYKERSSLASEAHRHLLHTMSSYAAMGLPMEHTYHAESDTENLVFPSELLAFLEGALRDAGFEFVPRQIVIAEELRDRLTWKPKAQ